MKKKMSKRKIFCIVGAAVILAAAALLYWGWDRPLGGVTLLSPASKEELWLVNQNMREYMELPEEDIRKISLYSDGKSEHYAPEPVVFTWEGDSGGYVLYLSRKSNFKDAMRWETDACSYSVDNLQVGTKYYWKVLSLDGEKGSETRTFTTAENQPRTVQIDGVNNTRDLGGYKTADGMRIRQGIVYRGASLKYITEAGAQAFEEGLGIKTELDLTGGTESSEILSVRKEFQSITWYDNIFREEQYREATKNALLLFTEEANFPIYFHCALGRDRTGTLAFMLLGLCGCEKETLYKEYMLTYFSSRGDTDGSGTAGMLSNIDNLYYGFRMYRNKDWSLADNIEAYMQDLGLTEENIKSIRANLTEKI